jgi:hypothetical protein
MYVQPFQISLETLVGAAPMLGHLLEDRSAIRDRQDWNLLQRLQADTSTPLRDESQQDLFCVAPLDVLVTQAEQRRQYHVIEINGTGIGGLTNLTGDAVSCVLDGLCQMAERLPDAAPLVLIASSGKESAASPRLNKLLHEKILYAEAMKRGFEFSGRPARVATMAQAMKDPTILQSAQPVILLGYMKEFLDQLECDDEGVLTLQGRQVNAAVNDRFCLNVVHRFGNRVDLNRFQTMNRAFLAGADKGIAYALLNEFTAKHPQHACLPSEVSFARVQNRDELIATVQRWRRQGRRPVIKPQGTGLGHGIEMFLDAKESDDHVIRRIDGSLKLTEEQYGMRGGAFPYTVCEFLDTCTIASQHPLAGHKYELRIVVYRDGMQLKAFPSIVKIASEKYDAAQPSPLSLINNITASAQAKQASGAEFMLPLCNAETLALLGMSEAELRPLCRAATRFLRHVLDQTQDQPALLGLPTPVTAAV